MRSGRNLSRTGPKLHWGEMRGGKGGGAKEAGGERPKEQSEGQWAAHSEIVVRSPSHPTLYGLLRLSGLTFSQS